MGDFVCMCVQKSVFFLFFRKKECWHKASHRGRSRKLDCSSRFVSFHLLCNESCSAARGRERDLTEWFKVKPQEGREKERGRRREDGREWKERQGKAHKPTSLT